MLLPFDAEKRLNEIILNDMSGIVADSLALADVRSIAGTCLSGGGRAVLSARGLCTTWLKEHYSENGCQPAPQGRSARVEQETGTTEYGLRLVPNPAHDIVRILVNKASQHQDLEVQVSSLDGRQVYRGTLPSGSIELTLSVGNWPQGLYVARVFDGDRVLTRSFVILHR